MERFLERLAPGLRALAPDGSMLAGGSGANIPESVDALVVLDLEMSGPNPKMHEVLELGAVRAKLAPGLDDLDHWGERVKPLHIGNAVPGALKVVGHSPKAWRQAMDLDAAITKLGEIGRDAIVTGWGIGADIAFLVESLQRTGKAWPFPLVALDVQPIARILLKDTGRVDRFNLGHVADRLGIGRMGEHSALADAYATYDVLVKLLELPDPAGG